MAYDARGNLTGSGGTTYAYWAENMLRSVSNGATLYYDPLDRLIEYDASASTRFAYDGSMISEEIANPGGGVLRRYASGAGTDETLVWYEGAGTASRRWLDSDERGSVTRITNDAGTVLAVNSYDEYGIPASGNYGRFQYTGQAWLPEIGLYDDKARLYSPTLGRFLQTDPIGYGDGLNWYNYTRSDPVNFTDPSGFLRTVTFTSCNLGTGVIGYQPTICTTTVISLPDLPSFRGGGGIRGGGGGGGGAKPKAPTTKTAHQKQYLDPGKVEDDPIGDIVVTAGLGTAARAAASLFEIGYGALSDLIASSARSVSSIYDTSITRAGSRYLNVQTNVGANEFQSNLISNGYSVSSQNAGTTVLNNGVNTYSLYTRSSTGSYGAQFFGGNGVIVKYSLGGP